MRLDEIGSAELALLLLSPFLNSQVMFCYFIFLYAFCSSTDSLVGALCFYSVLYAPFTTELLGTIFTNRFDLLSYSF